MLSSGLKYSLWAATLRFSRGRGANTTGFYRQTAEKSALIYKSRLCVILRRAEILHKRGRKMNKKNIRRGEIYLANLEPIIGSEQGGIRPVLIIQNNKGNKHSGTTIAAPITTKRIPNRLPVHVFTFAGQSGLPQNSSIMLEQIRVLDKSRLTDYVGRINDFTMDEVDRALKISVGLNKKYN